MPEALPSSSTSELQQIDALADRFEAEWKSGPPPRIESYLSQAPADIRSALLRELLRLEWQLRQRAGEEIVIGEYQSRFPDDREVLDALTAAPPTVAASEVVTNPPDNDATPSSESVGQTQYDVKLAELPVIGQYRLIRKMGQGGMGAVYSAEHLKLHKRVALKLLPKERTRDANAVSRFEREMKAVGQLDHPHIVRATDAGEADGQHFLVMDLIDGIDLNDLLKAIGPASRLPIAGTCELIRQAALGLQHAHEHGLVHRDIKPSNLMLCLVPGATGWEPIVKVLDFGLALLSSQTEHEMTEITSSQQVMGTLDYLAPEQASDSHRVDIRADLYSLGVTLYKLLTGRTPFADKGRASPMAKLLAISFEPPPPVTSLRPEIPPVLASFIHQLLDKDRDRRLATPRDVVARLLPFCAGCDLHALAARVLKRDDTRIAEPIVDGSLRDPNSGHGVTGLRGHTDAPPTPFDGTLLSSTVFLAKPRRPMWKQPKLIVTAFAVLVIGTLIILSRSGPQPTVSTKDDKSVPTQDEKTVIETAAAAPQAFRNIRVGVHAKADKPLELPTVAKIENPPLSRSALVQRPAKLPGVKGWSVETEGHRGAVWGVAFSPTDEHLLASACDDGLVRLWNAQTGQLLRILVGHDEAVRDVVWSPDGKLLASGSEDGTVRVWEPTSGRLIKLLNDADGGIFDLDWSHDG